MSAFSDPAAPIAFSHAPQEPEAAQEATVWSIVPVRGALDSNALADAVDLISASEEHDGARAFSDQSLLSLRRGSEEDVETFLAYAHVPARISAKPAAQAVAATRIDALAGVASVTDPTQPTLEMTVHPDYRQQGLGRALAETALATTAHDGLAQHSPMSAWAHGNLPASASLAASLGFDAVRNLVKMERPAAAAELPERPLAAGISVRSFDPSRDGAAWVELNAQVFAAHPEQGRLTLEDLQARMAEPWFEAEDFLIAEDSEGAMIGFNWLKRTSEESEIYAIGLDSRARGTGLGYELTRRGIERLRSDGPVPVSLYTEGDNTAALDLYAGTGFEVVMQDLMYRKR